MWTLTYSVDGHRHVEYLPDDLAASLSPLAQRGRAYHEALNEILTLNAQLVSLWRKQQRPRRARKRSAEGGSGF
jgi:hypothetical protein